MKDVATDAVAVGLVGAGTMGRGIAQVAVAAGLKVLWHDAAEAQLEAGCTFVCSMLDRQQEKGGLAPERCRQAKAGLVRCRALEELRAADVVIEAIVEDLAAKQALFRQLEGIVAADCVFATNTSSLPITALAAGLADPSRLAGFHFFNPVPLMKIVEVIPGLATRGEVVRWLRRLGERFGHAAPQVRDTPGFLVNHAGRGYALEALRIHSEGIAAPAELDRILCETAGFRMGPFALCDLIGIDVTHAVMESIYQLYYHEPRYRPALQTRQYRDAGWLGRKSGRGFYRYDSQGRPQPEPEPEIPEGASWPVWIGVEDDEPVRVALRQALERAGCVLDAGAEPGGTSTCLVAPLGEDATGHALRRGLPPGRTVAIDLLLGLRPRVCLMAPPVAERSRLDAVARAFRAAGHAASRIQDSCGFVVQRVLANLVNVSCDIAQQRIAAPADIDPAVQRGLGYPQGPLAWGDALGAARVLAILERLHAFYLEPRYRPSPWLRRRALLGVSLTTPELDL